MRGRPEPISALPPRGGRRNGFACFLARRGLLGIPEGKGGIGRPTADTAEPLPRPREHRLSASPAVIFNIFPPLQLVYDFSFELHFSSTSTSSSSSLSQALSVIEVTTRAQTLIAYTSVRPGANGDPHPYRGQSGFAPLHFSFKQADVLRHSSGIGQEESAHLPPRPRHRTAILDLITTIPSPQPAVSVSPATSDRSRSPHHHPQDQGIAPRSLTTPT